MAGGFKRLMRGQSRIDFVGRNKLWATISALVITGSAVALFTPGLNAGIEFNGGSSFRVPVVGPAVTVPDVEDALSSIGLSDLEVRLFEPSTCETETADGRCQTLEVRTEELEPDTAREVVSAVADLAGQDEDRQVSERSVSETWGSQVTSRAVRGLVVFLILVIIYIAIRFEPKMAIAAIAALIHDLLSTAGIYALTGLTVSPATVIALLTLMGFSLYDTVVVFDRIRENTATMGARERYGDMVNRSMNEVLVRSINTSVSSILPVAGLLFVGVFLFNAETLKDLAVAMFIATAVSIYSSIFVASPLLAFLKEREDRYRPLKERALAATRTTAPASTSVAAGPEARPMEPELDLPPTTPTPHGINRPIRPRRKRR